MPGRVMEENEVEVGAGLSAQKLSESKTLGIDNTSGTTPNGVIPSGQTSGLSISNGIIDSGNEKRKSSSNELPPEIPQVIANFQPLSKLFSRVAQDCFNGLNDTVTALTDSHEQVQLNGEAAVVASAQTARQSSAKRLRWLEFANAHRERFIKLLVLLQWSKRVGEVSKIIDVFAWMREQELLYEQVDDRIGHLKREMHFEKIPSPDLETALEILSKGYSSRTAGLDYIPPTPLSATKLLKTLKTVNTLLHIRLNLHEKLPPHFRTFRISSGRATFIVPHEFEVDLSIADEEPSSQFWFIDFRFLFSPSSEIPAGQLRNQLEIRANEVLASSGLSGCYDFFHDFVLTFKLNILRRQALELGRTSWAGSLRVEQVHRSLVIQYWIDRSGSKNWIEIGVHSGKEKTSTGIRKAGQQSQLALRWMRAAKEVEGLELTQLDITQLDASRTLQAVVARHIQYLMLSVRNRLASHGLNVAIVSGEDVRAPQMKIPLGFSKHATLYIEPTNGRMGLCPASAISERFEERLNMLHDQIDQLATTLINLRIAEFTSEIEEGAMRSGWTKVPAADIRGSTWSAALNPGDPAARLTLFKPWASSVWVLGVVVGSAERPSWWISKDAPAEPMSVATIRSIDLLPTVDSTESLLGRSYYNNLEEVSITHLTMYANMGRLNQLSVAHNTLQVAIAEEETLKATPIIMIQVSVLLQDDSVMATFDGDAVSLKQSTLKTAPGGQQMLKYVVHGRMHGSADFLRHLSTWRDPDIAFAEQGAFALQVHTTLDSPCVIDQVKTRLSTLSRIRRYLEIVRGLGFRCTAATINRITFTYARVKLAQQGGRNTIASNIVNPEVDSEATHELSDLTAEVDFDNNTATATFLPTGRNPHNHIRPFLTQVLNIPSNSDNTVHTTTIAGFSSFAKALSLTLPVLLALDSLPGQACIHVRSLTDYRLDYWRPRCVFSIRYFAQQDPSGPEFASMWYVEETVIPRSTAPPFLAENIKLRDAITEFWKLEAKLGVENGVVSLGKGLACGLVQLGGVLERLGAVVRECEDADPPYRQIEDDDDLAPLKKEDGEETKPLAAPQPATPAPAPVMPLATATKPVPAVPTLTPAAQATQASLPAKSSSRPPGSGPAAASVPPKQLQQGQKGLNGSAIGSGAATHGQSGSGAAALVAPLALGPAAAAAVAPPGKQQQQQHPPQPPLPKNKANSPEVIMLD